MLTLLARGQGVRTMLLTINRGEGGADMIAPYFFDALGVLRTLELLQSDRYYGIQQFHSRVVDYGYSKTLDEALTKWGGEENVLRDVVRVVRPDVKTYNGRLLDYAKNGGVLIVQYQTPEYDHNYGPYPYSQTRRPEEVSEEDSPVTILAPDNPLFNYPNKITLADFEGWVEERGSKFMKTWDERYTALIETHDQNQEPQKGGWVYAPYGQGVYIYSAYAWYRQLPHAVPGAFRLYANMISLRKTLAQQSSSN